MTPALHGIFLWLVCLDASAVEDPGIRAAPDSAATSLSPLALLLAARQSGLAFRSAGVPRLRAGSSVFHRGRDASTGSHRNAALSPRTIGAPQLSTGGEKKEGGNFLEETFKEYGVIAIAFLFISKWVLFAFFFTLLSSGIDVAGFLGDKISPDAAQAGGLAGRFAASLGLVELIGPVRIPLTLAATPVIKGALKQFDAFVAFEQWLEQRWSELTEKPEEKPPTSDKK